MPVRAARLQGKTWGRFNRATTRGVRVPAQARRHPALAGVQVKIIDHSVNEDLTGIVVAAEVSLPGPAATLRVADRFTVNAEGRIVEQENHFDPRDVTNPGWRDAQGR